MKINNTVENEELLLELRPKIKLDLVGEKTSEEQFMHITLRPILKFQHDKLILLISEFDGFKNELCSSSDVEKNNQYVKNFLSKNGGLKQKLIGCIIGLFTASEFDYYLSNQQGVNKRIASMIIERFLSSLNTN